MPREKPETADVSCSARAEPVPALFEWAGILGSGLQALEEESRNRSEAMYRVVEREGPPKLHWVYIPGIQTAGAVDSLSAQ